MKHILFISDNFYPEPNATANRLYDHARTWVSNGYQVSILTSVPNFPKGKVFQGYRNKWRQIEHIDGIKVIRIKSYIAANKGFLKRILDYMSFAIHAGLQGLFIQKPDMVIGTSPQPFQMFSAWFVARLKRKPFIFELKDLWPESIVAVGAMSKKNLLLQFFGWAIKRMYYAADVIVSVTDSFKAELINKQHINPEKIIICKNGIKANTLEVTVEADVLRTKYRLQHKFVVGYIGTIGMAHSVDTIIQAAKKNTDAAIHFIIMGAGAFAEDIENAANQLDNVTFINSGSRQDAINILNMLDASIVHLRNTPLFKTVIPSKIFEAMALGKPILMGVKGESREIVIDQARAGLAFEPQNPESLNKAITVMQTQAFDKNKPIEFVRENFDREKIAIKMLEEISAKLGK